MSVSCPLFSEYWKVSGGNFCVGSVPWDLPYVVTAASNLNNENSCNEQHFRIFGSYSDIDIDTLDSLSDSSEIVKFLLQQKGAWSLIYYRPDLSLLFVGRDVFGRMSLVSTRTDNGLFISCAVQKSLAETAWTEVPYGSISVIHLNTNQLDFHTCIHEYPDDTHIPWTDSFDTVSTHFHRDKKSLLEVSPLIDITPNTCYSQDFYNKLVESTSKLSKDIQTEEFVAIGFSGGVDSCIVALSMDSSLPNDVTIDLVNVAFGEDEKAFSCAPDRKRALLSFEHFTKIRSNRKWRLILVNIQREELERCRDRWIARAASPAISILDDSLSCVLWFAIRAQGIVDGSESDNEVRSPSRVFFVGSGADELFAGYARHRTRYERDGHGPIHEECGAELMRLGARNGGRDARIGAQHGRGLRAPFLEDDFVEWANSLPLLAKADLSQPRGMGEKKIIREALGLFNAPNNAPKQAMQFGSRMAKMDNAGKDVKGSHVSSNLSK